MDRFYVETADEFGPTEYDSFSTVEAARALARELIEVGFRYAVVVDRDTMCVVEKLGDLPHDWRG